MSFPRRQRGGRLFRYVGESYDERLRQRNVRVFRHPDEVDDEIGQSNSQPHRGLDEVDLLRVAMAFRALLQTVRAGEAPTLLERLRKEYAASARDVVRAPSLLQTHSDLEEELTALHAMFSEAWPEWPEWLEVHEDCIVWQQMLVGTPEHPWVRYCESCAATHVCPGKRFAPRWTGTDMSQVLGRLPEIQS